MTTDLGEGKQNSNLLNPAQILSWVASCMWMGCVCVCVCVYIYIYEEFKIWVVTDRNAKRGGGEKKEKKKKKNTNKKIYVYVRWMQNLPAKKYCFSLVYLAST